MRFSRVLLVHPRHKVEWPGLTPPLGLGYLAESLDAHGIDHRVLDMNLGYGLKHLLRAVDDYQPDLLGMSMITRDYRGFYRTLEAVRRHSGRLKIVAGGPHVTIFGEQVLRECAAIDYGVTREGERALVELCEGKGVEEDIKGLMFRRNGRIGYAGDRPFVTDLTGVPWPRYRRFEIDRVVSRDVLPQPGRQRLQSVARLQAA